MKLNSIILFSLLFLYGCVQNTIAIHVSPNGSFDMVIHAHGDENDILDNDFPITNILNNPNWSITSTIDSNDVDTHDMIAKNNFRRMENIPKIFEFIRWQFIYPFVVLFFYC